jgi:hypothetical protein
MQGVLEDLAGRGLHAAHLRPAFYGVNSTIAPGRVTYSLPAIAFRLRIKMMEKPLAISRFRHPTCSIGGWGRSH